MLIEPGMLAKSKAGRDKDCIYVIISVNDEYVYLADGKKRTVCRVKKKNCKHVQPISRVRCSSVSDNDEIRRVIKGYLSHSDACADAEESEIEVQKAQED